VLASENEQPSRRRCNGELGTLAIRPRPSEDNTGETGARGPSRASRRVGVGRPKRHNTAPAARAAIAPLAEAGDAFEHPLRPLARLDGKNVLTGDDGRCAHAKRP